MLKIRQCESKSIKHGAEKAHSSLAYLFKLVTGGRGVEKDKARKNGLSSGVQSSSLNVQPSILVMAYSLVNKTAQ